MKLIYKFEDLDSKKVKEVGGNNASLGEMFRELGSKGIKVPDGYDTSADAYWKFIRENRIEDSLTETLSSLDNVGENLKEVGVKCRELVIGASISDEVRGKILKGFEDLKKREESIVYRNGAEN